MNNIHKTAEGKRMFISEMDNQHLRNTFNMFLKGIEKVKVKIRNEEKPKDKFLNALYHDEYEDIDIEDLTIMLNQLCDKLYPYIAELMLRNINVSEDLQRVFERNSENVIHNNDDDELHLLG